MLTCHVAGSLRNVAHGLLRGIADLSPADLLDGNNVWVGGSTYWLVQRSAESFQLVGPDFDRPDAFLTEHTEDLTFPLWVSARQFEIRQHIGIAEVSTRIDDELLVQRSVVSMLEQGLEHSVVMRRSPAIMGHVRDDGIRRSGWEVRTPDATGDQADLIVALVGSFLGLMPEAAPFLALPANSLLHFNEVELVGAWIVDEQRVRKLQHTDPQMAAGQALLSGLAAEPILSHLFVESDFAGIPDHERPLPPKDRHLATQAARWLEMSPAEAAVHATAIPELHVIFVRNPATGRALVMGEDHGVLLGSDDKALVSAYLRGGRTHSEPTPG